MLTIEGLLGPLAADKNKRVLSSCLAVTFLSTGDLFELTNSVTRLGDFLHLGQLFKAFGNN